MRNTLLIICLCFISLDLFAQGQKDFGVKLKGEDAGLINSRSADSLIQIGEFYQVYYYGCGFRKYFCTDSLAKKYNFHPHYIHSGCFLFAKSALDSVNVFNNLMHIALDEVNGCDWQDRFDEEYSFCTKCLCTAIDSFEYLQYGIGCSLSLLYQQTQTELNPDQKCIINHSFVYAFTELPKLKVELIGNSSTSEEDALKTISRQRAENFRDYLISIGIKSERIEVSWNGADRPVAPPGGISDNQNRRVDIRFTLF